MAAAYSAGELQQATGLSRICDLEDDSATYRLALVEPIANVFICFSVSRS